MADGVELGKLVDHLRRELFTLNQKAEEEQLRFGIEEVEMEFHVAVSNEATASAGVKVLVLDLLNAEAKHGKQTTHTIKLKLKPRVDGVDGEESGKVEIGRGGRRRQM